MIVLLHVPNQGRTASDDPDTTTGLFSEKPSEAQKNCCACRRGLLFYVLDLNRRIGPKTGIDFPGA